MSAIDLRDENTYRKAQARIAKGYTPNMWATHEAQATQLPLIGGDK